MTDLSAGRELDALVAEKVMGLHVAERIIPPRHANAHPPYGTEWVVAGDTPVAGDPWFPLPTYSTSIAAAWEVVEKVDNRNGVANGLGVRTFTLNRYHDGSYCAMYFNVSANAITAPLAICLAALAAVGVTTEAV